MAHQANTTPLLGGWRFAFELVPGWYDKMEQKIQTLGLVALALV
jgi:hypothetical protein